MLKRWVERMKMTVVLLGMGGAIGLLLFAQPSLLSGKETR